MKHNYFRDEKLKYEDIEIPDELLFIVRRTVAADRKKKAAVRRNRILKTAGSVAAVLFLCLTVGVNSSYAFAEAAVKIPVVKDVAQAVVVRSYKPEIMAVYVEYKVSNRVEKTPEEIAEIQSVEAETVPTESGNDTLPVQEETPEQQPAEQLEAEELKGLESWKAEMTTEKLREVTELYAPKLEKKYADTPEKLRTILLAELTEKDISLYGYHEDGEITGAALRVGDMHQYFDWKYMDESGRLPEIVCEDIDGNGEEEIIIFLYNGAIEENEILKEEITAPEEDIKTETDPAKSKEEEKNAETGTDANTGKSDTVSSEKKEETGTESPTVSDNDAEKNEKPAEESKKPTEESEKPTEESKKPAEESAEPKQSVGEIWVISTKEETWTATALTVEDYESKIKEKERQG